MTIETEDDILEHYGVIGMRWGKRKERLSQVVNRIRKKSPAVPDNPDHFKGKPAVRTLSNVELKARINRLNLEKQYKQLTAPELSKGQKYVRDMLKNAAQEPVKAFIGLGVAGVLKRLPELLNTLKR